MLAHVAKSNSPITAPTYPLMISKNILVAALALPLTGTAFAGSPLLPLNDDGSAAVFFVADATAAFNDNIFYQKDKTDDVIFTVAPGFELVAGGEGNTKFNLVFKEALSAYVDNNQLNSQLANLDATLAYDAGGATKVAVTGGFHQTAQPNNQIAIAGDIVTTDTFYAGADAQYKATDKSKITFGGRYSGVRYTAYEQLFNDTDSFSVPASWLYAVTDKLDAGLSYRYTYTDISANSLGFNGGDQQVHFVGLTANGDVTPKLNVAASAGVGYSELTRDDGNDRDDTTFNFSLTGTYAATEKTTLSLTGAREFSVGAQGQQVTTTRGIFGVNYAIDEQWSANANAGYTVQDFAPGEDRILTAGCGVAYTPNKFWKFGANYSYMNDDSNRVADFDNHIVSITASLKY